MKKIFILIFAVIASVSCNDKDSKQDWGGMEYYTFEVSGKVTDTSGNPICGIRVDALGVMTTTRSDGTYGIKGEGNSKTFRVIVNFIDPDGDENGGRFVVAIKEAQLSYMGGAHGPYLGLYSATGVDARMGFTAEVVPPTDQPAIVP